MPLLQRLTIVFPLCGFFMALSACSDHGKPDQEGGAVSVVDGVRAEAGTIANGMDGGNPLPGNGGTANAEGGPQQSGGGPPSAEAGLPRADGERAEG